MILTITIIEMDPPFDIKRSFCRVDDCEKNPVCCSMHRTPFQEAIDPLRKYLHDDIFGLVLKYMGSDGFYFNVHRRCSGTSRGRQCGYYVHAPSKYRKPQCLRCLKCYVCKTVLGPFKEHKSKIDGYGRFRCNVCKRYGCRI